MHKKLIFLINKLLYLLILFIIPVSAQTYKQTTDIWDATAPLPIKAFDITHPCNLPRPNFGPIDITVNYVKSDAYIYDSFLRDTATGVQILLEGLCLDAATHKLGARNAYDRSKENFINAVDSLNQNLEIRRLRLQSNEQMYASLGAAVEKLLGGTSKSASRQMNKEIFRQIFKIATDSEIADIRKDLKNPAFSSPPGFTNTMRIPVIPVAGFLKLITKIQMPDGRHCTGSFVGPKIVLTNLHCVKPGMKVVRDHIVYREEYSVKTWWTFRGEKGTLTAVESQGKCLQTYCNDDWALIEINEDRPEPDDYLVVPAKTPSVQNVMIGGYSGDVSGGRHVSLDLNCPVEKVDANFKYLCSTYGGSSGSPIISMYDQRLIVALNNAGTNGADSANSRSTQDGVRVEKFAPKLYELLGKQPPEWTESNVDARSMLAHAKTMYEQSGKAPNLPKWE